MRFFAIGDLHLAHALDKPMDVFGEVWRDHVRHLAEAWRESITPDDLVLVPGDLSWARKLAEAVPDLLFLGRLPGRKLITRGNHDQWWDTTAKVTRACPEGVIPLLNDCRLEGDVAIAAFRGWDFPGAPDYDPADERVYQREVARLELALASARSLAGRYRALVVMMHYPPLLDPSGNHDVSRAVRSAFLDRMVEAGVALCVHGHVHGPSLSELVEGVVVPGLSVTCVSADWLEMRPRLLEL